MSKYITPRIDAVLASTGYWRCNEAPVYLAIHPDYKPGDKVKYKIVFPIPAINLTCMEKWFDMETPAISEMLDGKEFVMAKVEEAVKRFDVWSAVTYTSDRVNIAHVIYALTADFYYHECDWKNHDKYVRFYETLSGRKY